MGHGTMTGTDLRAAEGVEQSAVGQPPFPMAIVAALVAGLLLRLGFVFHYAQIVGDSLLYGDIAKNLLAHGVYGLSETLDGLAVAPHATLIRLPGYPLFVALCFRLFGVEHYRAILIVQTLVDLWTCLLIGGLAGRMFGKRARTAGVWMAALCPFTANYVAAPLTETLTLFCIALAFYALLRWQGERTRRWELALAFALGYAILLRPEQGLLAAAVVPAMVWIGLRRRDAGNWLARLRPAVLVSVLALLPLVPWAGRNWHTFHVFQPLAPRFANDPGEMIPFGFQRWYRTWAVDFASTQTVYWNYDGAEIDIEDLPTRAFDSEAQLEKTQALLTAYNETTTSTPAFDAQFRELADERVHGAPVRYYVALPAARVLNMMLRPRTEMLPVPLAWWRFGEHRQASGFALAYAALNLVFFGLAGATLARRRWWFRYRPLVWAMLATMALRTALLLTIDNSEPRYTLEFFPVLLVLGAATAASLTYRMESL